MVIVGSFIGPLPKSNRSKERNMITSMKNLTGGGSEVGVCETPDQIEFSIHNIKDVILSDYSVQKDEVFGDTRSRSLYIIHEVEINGNRELRRVKVLMFADAKDSLNMKKGNVVTSIHHLIRMQKELDKEGS